MQIVWDEEQKRWVDTTEDPNESAAKPPPPPTFAAAAAAAAAAPAPAPAAAPVASVGPQANQWAVPAPRPLNLRANLKGRPIVS